MVKFASAAEKGPKGMSPKFVMKRLERTGFVEERHSWVDTSGVGTVIKAHVSNDTSFILKEEYRHFKQIVVESNLNSVSLSR